MASVRKLLLALLFILPVLGLGIPAALAAGRINALTAAPNPTFANKPVTFSVQGTGNCHFRLTFGDGAPPLTATVPLPYQPPTHSYARSGTYTAIAKPVAGAPCTGQASINVTIQFSTAGPGQAPSSGAMGSSSSAEVAPDATKDLQCMLYGCSPQIDQLMLFSNITPGGGAIVTGSGFGGGIGPQNSLILTLTSYFNVPITVKLENLTWLDNAAGGTIPTDIRGIPDGPATLRVITAAGVASNTIDVNFRATREIRMLTRDDFPGSSVSCSQNGTDNSCTSHGNPDVVPNAAFIHLCIWTRVGVRQLTTQWLGATTPGHGVAITVQTSTPPHSNLAGYSTPMTALRRRTIQPTAIIGRTLPHRLSHRVSRTCSWKWTGPTELVTRLITSVG